MRGTDTGSSPAGGGEPSLAREPQSGGGAFRVALPAFEGPLDLLLHLIREHKVDVFDIPVSLIAEKYNASLELMRELNLDVAGEFLVMAATLMYIKSRELLPKDQQAQNVEEDEGEDPRWELIRQLVAYKKFKDAAAQLQVREIEQEHVFPRLPVQSEITAAPVPARGEASLFDLITAVTDVLRRVGKREGVREIFEDKWTVSEKIEHLVKLTAAGTPVKFSELFLGANSRTEVICTFLALLELIRLKQLLCVQSEDFGDIDITRAPAQSVTPSETATT